MTLFASTNVPSLGALPLARHKGEAMPSNGVSPTFRTPYRQAATLGGIVRRGETGALVVFADRFTAKDVDEQGQAPAGAGANSQPFGPATDGRWSLRPPLTNKSREGKTATLHMVKDWPEE